MIIEEVEVVFLDVVAEVVVVVAGVGVVVAVRYCWWW